MRHLLEREIQPVVLRQGFKNSWQADICHLTMMPPPSLPHLLFVNIPIQQIHPPSIEFMLRRSCSLLHEFVGICWFIADYRTSKEKQVKCDSNVSLWMLCLDQLTFLQGKLYQMIKSTPASHYLRLVHIDFRIQKLWERNLLGGFGFSNPASLACLLEAESRQLLQKEELFWLWHRCTLSVVCYDSSIHWEG